ncbi:MAG: DUF4384 domain-containing protein [Candidatus Sumerlaeota bacterium]|nr:DUF4384 domain-containing protein [Candidatus Sumerlaeota bacterium]
MFVLAAVAAASLSLTGCGQKLSTRVAVAIDKRPEAAISPDKLEFRTGDQMRLLVTPAFSGFCYVFHRGSSGEYHSLFPRSPSGMEPYEVKTGQPVRIPYKETEWLKFGDTPGTEWLYVIISKHKTDALTDLIDKQDPPSEEIAKALDKVKGSMTGDYTLTKTVKEQYTQYTIMSKEPPEFLFAEVGLQHR